MKHSTLSIALLSASAIMLNCAHAYAASGDNTAHAETAGATASPALETASPTSDSGLATEDASREKEQQLLGLPRVPKDTHLGDSGDDDATSTTRVALRRSTPTRMASATKGAEVFPAPFPSSIYPNGANSAVYKAPW
jgi:hypothetical protein